ncbi:MAG: hypothetical protein U9N44_00730 [Chloroflexota bacterium]|nr:hypothetical protein [Chloroflexota bacterium]
MREEQGKLKWYKDWRVYSLIFTPIVLIMLAGVWIMAAGGHPTPSMESYYYTAKTELHNAVQDYQNKNHGALPTINGTVTINGSAYRIIDICPLLTQNKESLQTVIESLWCGNGSNDDNWDGGCANCSAYSSYIWAVDDEGNVYSTCVGDYCSVNGVNGFQDEWP